MSRDVHCYDYVPAPYGRVRQALARGTAGIFQQATTSAALRRDEIVALLRVPIGPLVVGAEVTVSLGKMGETVSALGEPMTQLDLCWTAASGTSLLPAMEATLSLYPLTPHETQLEFRGRYHAPLGPLGDALDAVVGHRIAQASLRRFMDDLAARLRGVAALAP